MCDQRLSFRGLWQSTNWKYYCTMSACEIYDNYEPVTILKQTSIIFIIRHYNVKICVVLFCPVPKNIKVLDVLTSGENVKFL